MKHLIALISLVASAVAACAQSHMHVQLYPTQDQPTLSKISHFVQDGHGYIWFGTWDGLVRFDGQTTQHYKTYPGDSVHLKNQRVMHLMLSSTGNLWLTTYGRYSYYFDTEHNCFRNPLAAYGSTAQQLVVLPDGVAWAHTADGQYLRIEERDGDFAIRAIDLPVATRRLNEARRDPLYGEWLLTDRGAYLVEAQRWIGDDDLRYIVQAGGQTYLASRRKVYGIAPADTSLRLIASPASEILDLTALRSGQLVVSQRQRVTLIDPADGSMKAYPFDAAILRYVYEDSSERLWLMGSKHEVYMLEGGEMRTIPYVGNPVPATNAAFQYAFEDDYGTVWVQPGDSLPLAYYNADAGRLEQAFTYEGGRRRPLSFYIRSGAIDQQHNLWGNIDEVGFCYISFSRKEFAFVGGSGEMSSLTGMGARALMLDRQSRLWVGWRRETKSDEGGLALYDSQHHLLGYLAPDGHIVASAARSLQVNIYSMMQDSRGRIWLGSRSEGLYMLEPQDEGDTRFAVHHYVNVTGNPTSLSSNAIYDILEDHAGRIWIGTYGKGLDLVDESLGNDRLRFLPVPLKAEQARVRCLCETRDHKLMVGTNSGLLVADLSRLADRALTADELGRLAFHLNVCTDDSRSLAANNVMHITQLADGRTAVSTFGGGLNMLPPGFDATDTLRFDHYDARHGGQPDVIMATIEDDDGNLWIVSETGLSKYSPDMQLLDVMLQTTAFGETKPVRDTANHHLYLASKYDVLCSLYKEHQTSRFQPQLAFTTLSVHHATRSVSRQLSPADRDLVLQAGERNFTLRFIALDYAGQQHIDYSYRIDQLSDGWIPLGGKPSVNVVGLSAGHYTLEVRSTNADGVWCDNVTTLDFEIRPYFYETIWLKSLVALLLIGLVVYGLYYALYRIDSRRRSQQATQLAEAKVRFFTEALQRGNPDDEQFVRQLMQYIDQHMGHGDFSMEQVSAALGTNYTSLYRKVKGIMDITPIELVRQMRLQRAQRLLVEQPDLTVAEIAYQCGFSSPQYFNRVFKEQMRCTPVEFRSRSLQESPTD